MLNFETSTRRSPAAPAGDDARWEAVKGRDRTADGSFYFSVRTTGVYCRPSCAARLPRRENVRFHASTAQAAAAGFRPCKRCKPNDVTHFAVGESVLGPVLVAATAEGICAIEFGDDADALVRGLHERFPRKQLIAGGKAFDGTVAKVIRFVDAPARGLDAPIAPRGTAFQQEVWQALRTIPPGETASYADIAVRLGKPRAVRAVAQACATNGIAVAIPCHRVVRSDGALSGYRWGAVRKRALLEREKAQ
jgi:AraC family transcriptional regulator, regulatory protein of adaptative response / methylated-DNA-[protein]-cysteine methyltransferase